MDGTNIRQHDFVVCPWCGEDSDCRVDHLYNEAPRSFGPWDCRSCRSQFAGEVRAPGDVKVEKQTPQFRNTRSMALLKLEGAEGPVFFVMDHNRYWGSTEDTDADNQEHQRYFFEEHSCPTNWIDECVAIIENGDPDPHGFLSFVRAVDVPNDFDEDEADWAGLFPEAFGVIDLEANAQKILPPSP